MTAEEASRASHHPASRPKLWLPSLSPVHGQFACFALLIRPRCPTAALLTSVRAPFALFRIAAPRIRPLLPDYDIRPGNLQAIDIAALHLYCTPLHCAVDAVGHVRTPFWWLAAAGLLEVDERHTQARRRGCEREAAIAYLPRGQRVPDT